MSELLALEEAQRQKSAETIAAAHSELPQSEFADTQNVRAPPQGLEIDVGGARRGPPGVRE